MSLATDLIPRCEHTLVMGILNVTPDSFSDGGKWDRPDVAIEHALEMEALGAGLIDIGGESTRPGATKVSPKDEQDRIIPVIKGYLERSPKPLPISVDTLHAQTAKAAIEAGAQIINDVSGGEYDANMYAMIGELGVPYICQHMRGTPETMDSFTDYGGDVSAGVMEELKIRIEKLHQAGVKDEQIIVDPGLGFAKTHEQSWQLVAELDRLKALGYPILVGASRKRFLAAAVPQPLQDSPPIMRDAATSAITTLCAEQKIWAVRVHNVADSVAAVNAVGLARREK